GLEASGGPEPNRHRTVEMSAGNVANRVGHCQHSQPEGKADPKEANAERRETSCEHGATATRKGQPESSKELGAKPSRHIHDSSSSDVRTHTNSTHLTPRAL